MQSFTAIGRIRDREPYLYPQTPSFSPTRRDVTYFKAQAAPIEPCSANYRSFILGRTGDSHFGEA